MRYLVVKGAYLQVPYRDARGKWRYSTTVNGECIATDVPVEAFQAYIDAGHVKPISDEAAARLPRPSDPHRGLLLDGAVRRQG